MKTLRLIILTLFTFITACTSTNIFTQDYMNLSKKEVVETMPFKYYKHKKEMGIVIAIKINNANSCRYYNSKDSMLNDSRLMNEKIWSIFGDNIRTFGRGGTKLIELEFDKDDKVISQKTANAYNF